jgi:putative transcriptional regulator
MTFDLTGQMLIATPALGDPRFQRSLILLCAHSAQGAMGLVVNRPMRQPTLAEVMAQLDLTQEGLPERPVMGGGPVEPGQGFVLHSDEFTADALSQPVPGGLALTASTEILRAIATGAGPRAWLLALGYAGWGPGQLEQEIAANAWLTCAADPAIIFAPSPGPDQWEAALRSIGADPRLLSVHSGRA